MIVNREASKDFFAYGKDYYDGQPGLGYAGYNCDGRFNQAVKKIILDRGLTENSSILELGCAKGCILFEFYKEGFTQICGIDISEYALENAPEIIKPRLINSPISNLNPVPSDTIDFIFSKDTFPHLTEEEIEQTISEINRVTKPQISTCYIEVAIASNKVVEKNTLSWDPTHKTLKAGSWWLNKFDKIQSDTYIYLKELM